MGTGLATKRTVLDLIEEYDEKAAAVPEAIKAFENAKTA